MIKGENGVVVNSESEILKRWKGYFENLMNVESFREKREDSGAIQDWEISSITREEVEKALSRMKNDKPVGPDEIPVEAWKSFGFVALSF